MGEGLVWRRAWVALLAIVVGCSSGGEVESTTVPVESASPAATTPATPAQPTPTALVASTPSTSGLSSDDVAAITSAFETFFGGSTSTLDQKLAVLDDGETYREMLGDASENALFQQMSTTIRSIVPGSDTACAGLEAAAGCAVVTHDLLVGTMPMAAGIESAALRSADGPWLVAASAWCNVVAIGGESCEAALDTTSP